MYKHIISNVFLTSRQTRGALSKLHIYIILGAY